MSTQDTETPSSKSHRREASAAANHSTTQDSDDDAAGVAPAPAGESLYDAVVRHARSLPKVPVHEAAAKLRTAFEQQAAKPNFAQTSRAVVGALLHSMGASVTEAAVDSMLEAIGKHKREQDPESTRSSGQEGPDRVMAVFGATRQQLFSDAQAEVTRLTGKRLTSAEKDLAYEEFKQMIDHLVLPDQHDEMDFHSSLGAFVRCFGFTTSEKETRSKVQQRLAEFLKAKKRTKPPAFGDVVAGHALRDSQLQLNADECTARVLFHENETRRQKAARMPAVIDETVGTAVAKAVRKGVLAVVHGPSGAGKTVGAASAVALLRREDAENMGEFRDFTAVQVSPRDFGEHKATEDRGAVCYEKLKAGLEVTLRKCLDPLAKVGDRAGLAQSFVLVVVDEVGGYPEFVRDLCATHGDVAERLRTEFLHVGGVALVAAGTGTAGATHKVGSRDGTYTSIRAGANPWPELATALERDFQPTDSSVISAARSVRTALRVLKGERAEQEPPGIVAARGMLENARAAVLFARCLRKQHLVVSAHRPVPGIVALAQRAALQFKELNGLDEFTNEQYVSLIFDAHVATHTSATGEDGEHPPAYAKLVSTTGVLDDRSRVLSRRDFMNLHGTTFTLKDGTRWCHGDVVGKESEDDTEYVCWPAAGRYALPASQVALAQLAAGLVPHDATGEGFEQSVADYFHFVLRACWPVRNEPRSGWSCAAFGPSAAAPAANVNDSTPQQLVRDMAAAVYQRMLPDADGNDPLAALKPGAVHFRVTLQKPFERGNETDAADELTNALTKAEGAFPADWNPLGSVVCVNAAKAASWDVMVRVHPPGGTPDVPAHCWLVQVKRFTKDTKLTQVQLRAELGKMGHPECLVEYCAYFVWKSASAVPECITKLVPKWSQTFVTTSGRSAAGHDAGGKVPSAKSKSAAKPAKAKRDAADAAADDAETNGRYWRSSLLDALRAANKSAKATQLLVTHHSLDVARLCKGPVRYVLLVHADSWADGLECPRDATLVKCAKDGLRPIPVDWSDSQSLVAMGGTDGRYTMC